MSQPNPVPNSNEPVWDILIKELMDAQAHKNGGSYSFDDKLISIFQDMMNRNKTGIQRYGTPLQAFNGRNALSDAYEEILDMLVYLKQSEIEMPDPDVKDMISSLWIICKAMKEKMFERGVKK